MRELKFRAWCQTRLKRTDDYTWQMVPVKSIHLGTKKIIVSHWAGNMSVSFNDCEIMQFTGLQDINGVDIYEGDIVKDQNRLEQIVEYKNNSEREDFCLKEFSGFELWTMGSYEVIGNIHETPSVE